MSMELLRQKIEDCNNPTIVGLDPDYQKLPEFLKKQAIEKYGETLEAAAFAVQIFNHTLIDALCDIVPAVKPQYAFYEQLGWYGMRILADTISYAHEKGMFVLADGKRGDVGATMQAYAHAHLGDVQVGTKKIVPFGADALTVNAYLGSDSLLPVLEVCKQKSKCVFVLAKTSNPSSGEIQDLTVENEPLYMKLGHLSERWSKMAEDGFASSNSHGDRYGMVGVVAGATYPVQLSKLRKELPRTFFLVPGYGMQGGVARDVAPAFDKNGDGAIVASSRSILYAWKKEECGEQDFAGAARRAALRMQNDLNTVRGKR
ncbi:MAG TPA: orotidine-5'-phosphate decarboxylase [Ruminococcaceae bacterium]|nr:orotidine-5'-phosphate decarboxylase [Oscillospiraceae bacterium]